MSLSERQYERLIAFAAGELSPADAIEVEAELRTDAEAAATVARFRAAAVAVRTDASEAPPAETLAAAKAIFRSAPAAPTLFEQLKRVVAALIYDSRAQPALVGVRGAEAAYQLSYESELADVDVQVERAGGDAARRLVGQITLHKAQSLARVVLMAVGTEQSVATADVDGGGVFSLTAGPGNFDLWIALADAVLVVPGVEVH